MICNLGSTEAKKLYKSLENLYNNLPDDPLLLTCYLFLHDPKVVHKAMNSHECLQVAKESTSLMIGQLYQISWLNERNLREDVTVLSHIHHYVSAGTVKQSGSITSVCNIWNTILYAEQFLHGTFYVLSPWVIINITSM